MFRHGLKAGVIGGIGALLLVIAGVVVELIPQLAVLSCCVTILYLVLWLGVGVLAAFFAAKQAPLTTSDATTAGATAGLVTGIIGGLLEMIASGITALVRSPAEVLQQIPPEQLRSLEELGIDPQLFASPLFSVGTTFVCCCLFGSVVAAALGAIGGLLYAVFTRE